MAGSAGSPLAGSTGSYDARDTKTCTTTTIYQARPPTDGLKCRQIGRTRHNQRIEEVAIRRLIEKFSPGEPTVSTDGGAVVVQFGPESHVLDREEAAELRRSLGDALAHTAEFVRTVGEHRRDGSYVVSRRGADSSGHRKVFDSFCALEALYAELPEEFTAADVEASGVSGGRRHMLLRHVVEHPRFDCELVSRQPLIARKRDEDEEHDSLAEEVTDDGIPAD